jgi:hypothetical protein
MEAGSSVREVSRSANGFGYAEYRGNFPVHTTADVDEYNGKTTVRGISVHLCHSCNLYQSNRI